MSHVLNSSEAEFYTTSARTNIVLKQHDAQKLANRTSSNVTVENKTRKKTFNI